MFDTKTFGLVTDLAGFSKLPSNTIPVISAQEAAADERLIDGAIEFGEVAVFDDSDVIDAVTDELVGRGLMPWVLCSVDDEEAIRAKATKYLSAFPYSVWMQERVNWRQESEIELQCVPYDD